MIGLGWLFYRPLIGIAIIVVGGAVAYGTGLMARRAGVLEASPWEPLA